MPKKKYKSVQDMLQIAVKDVTPESKMGQGHIPDIITFCESPEYLGLPHLSNPINLYPAQRIILKVFYRGSLGNEEIQLTKKEIKLCQEWGLNCEDNGDILRKYSSNEMLRELVLVWGRRCISEDMTLIDPKDGSINKIGELYDACKKNIDSWTYNEETKQMEIIKNADIIEQGIREVFKLTTNSGHEIEVTANHPFLTQRGWIKLEDINIEKDRVAIVESVPFFGNSDAISENEAALLGYMTGDGNCSQSATFFTCGNKTILYDFSKRLNKISNNIKIFNDPWTGARSKKSQYKITSKKIILKKNIRQKNDLMKLMVKWGLAGKTCHKKTVPLEMFKCPKNVIVSYLRALFSCDGNIHVREKLNVVIFEFTTVNKQQAILLQHLLSKFNILARVRCKKVKSSIIDEKGIKREYDTKCYILHFSRKKYIELLLNQIGFIGKDYFLNKAFHVLKKISSNITTTKRNDIYTFEKIRDIKNIGEKRVFDVSVSHKKKLQNFVSQGFIVKNSGKDFLVSIIALYEATRLLECPGGDPYALYNLSSANPITILTIAVAGAQAEIAFKEMKEKVIHSKYFIDKIGTDGVESSKISLLTLKDKKDNKEFKEKGLPVKKGSIVLESGHSNSDSLLGKGVFVLILDEVASYKTSGGASSGERIYTAMTPALSTYFRRIPVLDNDGNEILDKDGKPKTKQIFDSKIVSISSPRGKEGIFYRLFFESDNVPSRLACRLPTWKVDPNQTKKSLRKYNPSMTDEKFEMEFGAEFSGTAGESFFPKDSVELCFHKDLKSVEIGQPGKVYFIHLDPARTSHNYGLVIVHKENLVDLDTKKTDFYIVVDHIKYWHPVPGKPINVEEVQQYVIGLKKRFHIGMVTYDHWNSQSSIKKLRKHGIPAKCTPYLRHYKMAIYDELYDLIIGNRLRIPYHRLLKDEMINLQRKYSNNGYKVYPRTEGDVLTDDIVDCVAGACYNAFDVHHNKLPTGKLVNTGISPFNNNIVWQGMQGPIGRGYGPSVAKMREERRPYPYGNGRTSIF